ncbi:MAG: KEOPS complex subunit Cgi121 [Candidatus Bathyarchaeota archaeon]|nr:KEOPS complex subunit Cgi121 [Candidatus Bathyarchaeota archaeon]
MINESLKLKITSLKNVKIDNVEVFLAKLREKFPNISFQVFDADKIVSGKHIELAFLNAVKAFKLGKNISKNFSVEVTLYVSGQRQIKKAFELVGLTVETRNITLAIFNKENEAVTEEILSFIKSLVGGEVDNNIINIYSKEKTKKIMKTFKISNIEVKTLKTGKNNLNEVLEKLVLERVALLAVQE